MLDRSNAAGRPRALAEGAAALRPDAGHDDASRRYGAARQAHAACMVCGECHSLGLSFAHAADGSVCASFAASARHQGYHGILHGGMISTLLDAAMTHCLFAHGVQAVTAELTVRFVAPVAAGSDVVLTAHLIDRKRRSYRLEARLSRGSRLLARATGKFIEMRPDEGLSTGD